MLRILSLKPKMNKIISTSSLYLLKELSKREIFSRYKGSFLGVWWALFTPLAMLLVFTFVFGEIFQAKWPGGIGNIEEFSVNLYAGLIIFWFFNEVVSKAPSIIVSQPNYVTKVIFPLELLPVVTLVSALFHLAINSVILYVSAFVVFGEVHIGYMNILWAVLLMTPMLLGLGWFFSALGVYIRDTATVIGLFLNLLMFLSPIFYPMQAVPERLQWLFTVNPLTLPIEWVRNGITMNQTPFLDEAACYALCSILIGWGGRYFFKIVRQGFADVL